MSSNDEAGGQDNAGGQADLLGEMRVLRRRARAARHAYWFPLVLFGLLIGASAPFYLQMYLPAGPATGAAGPGPRLPFLGGEFSGSAVQHYLGYYWLAALLGGLLLTLLWYRWNARRVGLQTPARGYVITVAVLTALALLIPLLPLHLQVLWPGDLVVRGTFPFIIIAAGLWALAWAERSRALVVIAAVYSGAALLASLYNVENLLFRLGWNPGPGDLELTALPNVLLPAIVLLAAGAGAFAVQQRREPAAA
jgi:hypothetical protein